MNTYQVVTTFDAPNRAAAFVRLAAIAAALQPIEGHVIEDSLFCIATRPEPGEMWQP